MPSQQGDDLNKKRSQFSFWKSKNFIAEQQNAHVGSNISICDLLRRACTVQALFLLVGAEGRIAPPVGCAALELTRLSVDGAVPAHASPWRATVLRALLGHAPTSTPCGFRHITAQRAAASSSAAVGQALCERQGCIVAPFSGRAIEQGLF